MHPTPAQVIDGVRTILRDVVEPELESDYVRGRVREIRAVLAQIDWNDSVPAIARDNATVAAMLIRHRCWIEEHLELDDEVRAALTALLERDASLPIPSFRDVNNYQASLAAIVVALVNPVGDWVVQCPGDSEAAELLTGLQRHYS